jgi:hypothetical protein
METQIDKITHKENGLMDSWSETSAVTGGCVTRAGSSRIVTGPWLSRGESHAQWLIRSASLVHGIKQLAQINFKAHGNMCRGELRLTDVE